MRVNKSKFIRKYLRFYRIVFKLQEPYNIILDGNFIFQAINYKLDIQERLGKLLQGSVIRLYIQQSALEELRLVGLVAKDALHYAKTYCTVINDVNREGNTPGNKLVQHLEKIFEESRNGTKRIHYIVATQDKELRSDLSKIPGIPLIYFNKVSLVLEPPSKASRNFGMHIETEKVSLQMEEKTIMENIKLPKNMTIVGLNSSQSSSLPIKEVAKPRLQKKATAPNPLSSRPSTKDSKAFKKRHQSKFVKRS